MMSTPFDYWLTVRYYDELLPLITNINIKLTTSFNRVYFCLKDTRVFIQAFKMFGARPVYCPVIYPVLYISSLLFRFVSVHVSFDGGSILFRNCIMILLTPITKLCREFFRKAEFFYHIIPRRIPDLIIFRRLRSVPNYSSFNPF